MSPEVFEAVTEVADDARRLVWEHERADVIGTERPGIDDLKELADKIGDIEASGENEPACACFEGIRWPKMSQAERRRVLTWLRSHAGASGVNEHSMGLDAVVEALQVVCETEGVI